MSRIAVLLTAYNRPEKTREALEAISRYQPTRFYVACDGPKSNESDRKQTELVREVLRNPDWECDLHTRFLPSNVGPGRAMSDAIDWFFSNEESGIILEDDCIASLGFFQLVEHFLERYRDQPKVWGLTGSNTFGLTFPESYGFIQQPLTWGWATWRDRWAKNDHDLNDFDQVLDVANSARWPSEAHRVAFSRHLQSIAHHGKPDAWDYQWAWTIMKNQGLWAVSREHLISNVGFDHESTNVHPKRFIGGPIEDLKDIRHPVTMVVHSNNDELILRRVHGLLRPLWINRILNRIRALKNNLFP